MSKTVTIPTDGMNPFVVIFNGVKYVYTPGETVEVPDGVALEIEEYKRWREKHPGENVPPFGAQPDWEQNDPNAPDFVKNRTHYAETVEATVLEKTTFTELEEELDEDSGATRYYYAEFYRELTLVDGKTYFVTFNGVRYECVYDSDSEVLGNLSIWGEGDDTGEPFVIDPWSACIKTDEPFTVVITTMEESVTTIPEKYLPPEE